MKLFQVIQKKIAFLGISSNQPFFNAKSMLTFLFFGLGISFSIMFIFYANTFLEYIENIFVIITELLSGIDFIIVLLQREKFFKFIDNIEEYVDKSK